MEIFYINKIQQDATYAGVHLLQNNSTCFGCLSHPSSGVHQTVTAVSGTGHNVLPSTWPIGHLVNDMRNQKCGFSKRVQWY